MRSIRLLSIFILLIILELNSINLWADEKLTVKISNGNIEVMVVDGIDAIYDLHHEKYKTLVVNAIYSHNSYVTGSPEQHTIAFQNVLISNLAKLNNQIPFETRKFFWDFSAVVLTEKMYYFIDSFKPKHNLDYLKPKIEDGILKECRVHGIFG